MTQAACTLLMSHNPHRCQQLPIAEKRQGPELLGSCFQPRPLRLHTAAQSWYPHLSSLSLTSQGAISSAFYVTGKIWEHSHREQAGQDTGTRGCDTERSRPLCGSSHAKDGSFSMWHGVVGWRGAEQTAVAQAAGRGSSLPTHFLCALRI